MERSPDALGEHNLDYVEELYRRWLDDPTQVGPEWRNHFAREGNGVHGADLALRLAPRSIFDPARGTAGAPAKASGSAVPAVPRPPKAVLEALPAELSSAADKVAALRAVPLFAGLPADQLARIATVARELRCAAGQLLFRQGDKDPEMYLVLAGSVVISQDRRVLAELGPGEVVGEMAVLDDQPRSADGRASGELRVLELAGADLKRLMRELPGLTDALVQNLTGRLRKKNVKQDAVDQLIRAYRVRGHLHAKLDPLDAPRPAAPELELAFYGLGEADLDTMFSSTSIAGTDAMSLREIQGFLKKTYAGAIGVQYMHIDDLEGKRWIQHQMENIHAVRRLTRDEQLWMLTKLSDAETFETFLHKKFVGAKRFSLEGAETMIPLLGLAIEEAARYGVEEVVIGMPHRGRLNVLANILGKSPRKIFREFDDADAHLKIGRGDVKYHLGYSNDVPTTTGGSVHLSLAFNPSHLEFVGPVVAGRVRAKQDRRRDRERRQVLGVVLHGDAAFAGQGVGQELLNMSELEGYRSGGTLHVIVNNQIGFTTPPAQARSTQYATDVCKMLQTPIFHVNGEEPEAVAQVVRWALAYRARFQKDVVIDMYCYRRHGHNEGDEPSFTQPKMYEAIRRRPSVVDAYLQTILRLGEVTKADATRIVAASEQRLEEELVQARSGEFAALEGDAGHGIWTGYHGGKEADATAVETRVPHAHLAALLERMATIPPHFKLNPKLERFLEKRRAMAKGEAPLDWSAGEALGFATLLVGGHPIRLSGQDVERGTFSHRHAVFHDVVTERRHIPLANLGAEQAEFRAHNSPLSEIAVLGFDWGYSLDVPDGLVIWEAQFGDFCNVAQVIIDQFIASAEDKWHRLSGLAMFLPHGFEGQGPEHSSARLERFLALAAQDNLFVMNLTTPAQLFHALRRSVVRKLRKPMIVMSPKSLLRHPDAVSSLDELALGAFQPVIGDAAADPAKVERVLVVSGKLYYELAAERAKRGRTDVAIVRLEQYYPFPAEALAREVARFGDSDLVWVQEEPWNMGAWPFLRLNVDAPAVLGRQLLAVTRPPASSPATGSAGAHKQEQASLISRALA